MNIRLFGLTLDGSGVIKTMKEVTDASVNMAQAGAKNAQLYADAFQEKLNRVARQYIPETMRAIDALRERQQSLGQSTQLVASQTMITAEEFRRAEAAYAAARVGFDGVSAAEKAVAESSGLAFTGLGRIRQGLTSLIASVTGTMPVLDRIISSFGSMAVGSGVMVGALAGIAAAALAYHALTRDARDAEAAQDAALKKLVEWDRQRHLGGAGQLGADVENASGALGSQIERQRIIAGIGMAGPAGAGVASLLTVFGTETKKQFAADVQAVSDGRQALGAETTKLMLEERGKQASMLADVIANGNATHAQRQRAIQLLKEDTALAAQYGQAGMLESQAAVGDQAKGLHDALYKQDAREAEREFQRTLHDRIAQQAAAAREGAKEYQRGIDEAIRGLHDLEAEEDRENAIRISQFNEQTKAAQRAYQEELDAAARTFKDEEKYRDDMHREWSRGLERMLSSGLTSWHAFFESVFSLFEGLMRRMEQHGKDNGLGYRALQYGSLAISGGVAGFETGQSLYSSSHGTAGNNIRGALGGAASGAAMGAMLGSVVPGIGTAVGAIVGGAAGFIGGVLGMGSAAKDASRQMAEAVKQVTLSMAALRAEVGHDTVGAGIAAIEADRAARIKAVEDAWSGGGAGSDRVLWRTAQEKEINRLEDERIAQLRQEYALTQKRAYEDLRVRDLASRGLSTEADALARQLAQQREMEQYVKDGADPATLALLQQVQAQEKLAAATTRATTSALNMVEGYNIVAEAFRFSGNTTGMVGAGGSGSTAPASFAAPTGPARGTPQPTAPVMMQPVVLEVDGKEVARIVKRVFIDDASRSGNGDAYNWGRGL